MNLGLYTSFVSFRLVDGLNFHRRHTAWLDATLAVTPRSHDFETAENQPEEIPRVQHGWDRRDL